MTTMLWIQREFRLHYFPALAEALQSDKTDKVIVVYFHDPEQSLGGANDIWLSQSLLALQQQLKQKGGALWMVEGEFASQLAKLIEDYQVDRLYYSFQVGEPFQNLQNQALDVCKNAKLLLKPFFSEYLLSFENALNQQKSSYLVFTPFYQNLLKKADQIESLSESASDTAEDWHKTARIAVPEQYRQLPSSLQQLRQSKWGQKILVSHKIGETFAKQQLDDFLEYKLDNYAHDRDFPSVDATSQLSAALHFGQLNIRALFEGVQRQVAYAQLTETAAAKWLRQIVWREYARHLLYWFPYTSKQPFQQKYQQMAWQSSDQLITVWQKGQTGIPIIDAGMRELWQTGFMHNRVRMLVASFLTKNLNQHWLHGLDWFNDTLCDADPANNIMGWQWVAGCGVDAAPYYRLFNPVLQSQKFDPNGDYLRLWLPELTALSNKAIHAPWENKQQCLAAGIELGIDYPEPIVDLKISRELHLQRVEDLKGLQSKRA